MAADLIDLHTHTNCSDGDYAPAELLRLAKKRGVKTIAITDHDTVDGYDKELFLLAKELEIKLIPGIEFSTIDEESGQKIHALGLGIDSDNKALREKCARLRADRVKLMGQIAEKLASCGFILRVDELAASGEIITKAHIARDVLANEVNRRRLIKAHGNMPLQGEFIEKWLIKGCPAFVPKAKPLLTHEAIDIIHQAGGISSCAHPSFNVMKGFSFENMKQLILRNKFDAVEAVNIQYDKENGDQRFDMIREFTQFAKESNLLITGGSDYHSDNHELWGNMPSLGMADEVTRPGRELVDNLNLLIASRATIAE